MKIAFFEIEGWEEAIIRENFPNDEIFISKEKLTSLAFPETKDFDVISVFIDSRIDKEILKHFPNLKLVTTRSTGYDHIDIAACKERGIVPAFVPGYGDNTVAEFTFGLILNLTRKIYQSIDQIKERGLFSLDGLRGVDLKGKTIGIVGTGRIGKEMVKISKGFGMNVVAYDPFPDAVFAQQMNFEYLALEDLLKNSDIISLHCPLNEKTRHLINMENIQFVKKGAYFINTARGGIIDTNALIKALEKGIFAGAALDVLEEEGEIKDELMFLSKINPTTEQLRVILENHLLMKMPNVLITPHNAFNSQEALQKILSTTILNIKGFIENKPVNAVN